MLFTLRRSISTIIIFLCLICAAKAISQTRDNSSGKFINEGLTSVLNTHVLQVMTNAPPPEDCPGAPPCPTVLRSSIGTLENGLRLTKQSGLAILYRPSKKTILSKLTLSLYQGYELKYQSDFNCQGCGNSYEPVNNVAKESTTGYLFNLDEQIRSAIDEYKSSPQRIVVVIQAEAKEGEINKEEFFFVRKED